MDFNRLLEMGARAIEGSPDPETSGMDLSEIASALSEIFKNDGMGTSGIAVLIQKAMASGLGEVVGTWIGQGENARLDADQVEKLVDADTLARFARALGVQEETAKRALADALPKIVDEATPPEDGPLDALLAQIGNLEGTAGIFGRMFR
ncbi:YidB family protein [Hydrogenimonas sp.]